VNLETFQLYHDIADKFDDVNHVDAIAKKRIDATRKEMLHRKGLIVDVGCGHGTFSLPVDYVGLDCALPYLKQFDEPKIRGLVESLPFKNVVADHVLLSEVIEHVEDKQTLLRECYRILKVGGEIILTCPIGNDVDKKVWYPILTEHKIKGNPYLHSEIPVEYVAKLLRSCGFQILRIKMISKIHVMVVAKK